MSSVLTQKLGPDRLSRSSMLLSHKTRPRSAWIRPSVKPKRIESVLSQDSTRLVTPLVLFLSWSSPCGSFIDRHATGSTLRTTWLDSFLLHIYTCNQTGTYYSKTRMPNRANIQYSWSLGCSKGWILLISHLSAVTRRNLKSYSDQMYTRAAAIQTKPDVWETNRG